MPLVNAKCTNCGANLKIDDTNDAAICEYCGSAFVVEKAINNYNVNVSNTNNITADVVNVYSDITVSISDFSIVAGKLVGYFGSVTDVVIPNDVKIIGESAFSGMNITSVIMPDSVEEIERYAFMKCSSLKKVILSDRIYKIAVCAFSDCTSLEEVMINERVSDERLVISDSFDAGNISLGAFDNCSKLKIVHVPNGITRILDRAFRQCDSLKEIVLSKNMKTVSGLAGSISLQKVELPEGIEEIGPLAFEECTELTDINIPSSLKVIAKDAFKGCGKINIDIDPYLKPEQKTNELKDQYEEMLAKEQAANQPKQKTKIDILRNAKFNAYELKQSPKSLEAVELIKPDKWKKTSDVNNLKAKNYLDYFNFGEGSFNIKLAIKKRITDDDKEYLIETDQKWGICETTRKTSSGSLSKMAAKKLCLEKAEECFNILRQNASEQIEYVEDWVLVDISDSGTRRSQRIVLFKDGYYYFKPYSAEGEYWLDFIKQVNGD